MRKTKNPTLKRLGSKKTSHQSQAKIGRVDEGGWGEWQWFWVWMCVLILHCIPLLSVLTKEGIPGVEYIRYCLQHAFDPKIIIWNHAVTVTWNFHTGTMIARDWLKNKEYLPFFYFSFFIVSPRHSIRTALLLSWGMYLLWNISLLPTYVLRLLVKNTMKRSEEVRVV